MIEEGRKYNFKKEFCPLLGITKYTADRRKDDLLEWLKNFYNYEILSQNPITIIVHEVLAEYRTLPKKKYDSSARYAYTLEKQKDYEKFVINALGTIYKPNSKSKIARDAIHDFSRTKYGHRNQKKVVENYVKEPFSKNAITNDKNVWVYYDTYKPLDKISLQIWKTILSEEKIGEEEAANAFYRQENGEDITEEKTYFQKALERFKLEYGEIPVLVKEWKVKDGEEKI